MHTVYETSGQTFPHYAFGRPHQPTCILIIRHIYNVYTICDYETETVPFDLLRNFINLRRS